MHVLIIPSEEFIPPNNHLAGIFQKHQAMALQKVGCKVGVLSIRQSLSIPMICKAFLFRLLSRSTSNELGNKTLSELLRLLYNKVFYISKFISVEDIADLTVIRIDGFYFMKPSKHYNHIGWLIAGKNAWKRYCEINGTPDVIHAHNAVYAGILANRISKRSGVPYFLTEHSSFIARNLESELIKEKIKRAYLQASSFFVVSDFLGLNIDILFQEKFNWKLMPNVLDPEIELDPLPVTQLSTSPFIFINIASLIPLKRHSDLITAFYQQFSGDTQVQLIIAGDGELKKNLEVQIDELNLVKQVKLLGRISRGEVCKLIDQSHCLILNSEIETFGVVLIEALSRGKPVISSKSGGPEFIINETNGILFPVGDIQALSKSMFNIKKKYQNFSKNEIRNETIRNYGNSIFGEQLKNEYQSIFK